MVKPPVVYTAGLLRAVGRGDRHRSTGSGSTTSAGQRLFYPPNVAGWDDTRWLDTSTFRGRWDVASYVRRAGQLDENRLKGKLPADAEKLLSRALVSPRLADAATSDARDPARIRRTASLGDAKDDGQQKTYPVMVENALRQLIAISPDAAGLVSDCALPRLHRGRSCSAGRRPRPGVGLPAIEPGMPLPGRDGAQQAHLRREERRARARRLRGGSLGLRQLEEGIASAAGGPAQTVLVSIFLDGGADALSVLYPDGDPLYRKLRPKLALPAGAGPAFAADARLRWHPVARSARDAPRRGEGHRRCRRSATRIPTSRTSRRATTGRWARPTSTC